MSCSGHSLAVTPSANNALNPPFCPQVKPKLLASFTRALLNGGQGPKRWAHSWEHFWGPGAVKRGPFMGAFFGARGRNVGSLHHVMGTILWARGRNVRSPPGDIIGGQGPKYGVPSWEHYWKAGPKGGVHWRGHYWGPGAEIKVGSFPSIGALLGARGRN